MNPTKRRRRVPVQQKPDLYLRREIRRKLWQHYDESRSKRTYRRYTEGRAELYAEAIGLSRGRIDHRRTDERDEITTLDRMIWADAAEGVDASHPEMLPLHFSTTIALAYGLTVEECLLDCLERTLEPDAREDLAKAQVMLAAARNGSISEVPTDQIRELKACAEELIQSARRVVVRCAHELAGRAA